ncbi:MAG TPA: nuclease-related domain-containing protein [Acidimicrobiales bacterium]|nr:nuclease-related domain-containing protein [Acidimicrobiales bacterium]
MAEEKRTRRETTIRSRHPHLGGLILAVTDEPQDIKNWDKGAVGEEKLAAGLDGLAGAGVVAIHDRLRPGGGQANIDHLAVTPAGVWVIDAKRYSGRVAKRDVGGWFSTDVRLFVGRRDCTRLVDGMAKQVDAVRRTLGEDWADVPVRPMLCFVDGDFSWFARPFELNGVLVTWPRAARERLVQPGPYAVPTVAEIAARLDERLRPAS